MPRMEAAGVNSEEYLETFSFCIFQYLAFSDALLSSQKLKKANLGSKNIVPVPLRETSM